MKGNIQSGAGVGSGFDFFGFVWVWFRFALGLDFLRTFNCLTLDHKGAWFRAWFFWGLDSLVLVSGFPPSGLFRLGPGLDFFGLCLRVLQGLISLEFCHKFVWLGVGFGFFRVCLGLVGVWLGLLQS